MRSDDHSARAYRSITSPELALRQAVKSRPEDATQMIKARNAMIDRAAFFNPQNLQRLLGSEMRG